MSNRATSVTLPPQWIAEQDTTFFARFPQRKTRIRKPFGAECEAEFRSLGDHERDRRRVVLWRVPEDNPFYERMKQPILKIPFLLFSDETVEDEDAVLLPIIHEIMESAR